jgi:cytochrome c551/c552
MKSNALLLLIFSVTLAQAAPPVEEGETIFTTRCAGCHNINKQVVGPALAGIDQRRSMEWIINFVHSSQTLVKKGDKEATALFKEFNGIPMPDHKDLSDDNIKNVVAYIQSEAGAAAKKDAPATKTAAEKQSVWQTITESPGWLATFSVLALVLVASFVLAYYVRQQRRLPSAAN